MMKVAGLALALLLSSTLAHAGTLDCARCSKPYPRLPTPNPTPTRPPTPTIPAILQISDGSTYDFGTVANGAAVEKIFTVTNAGYQTAGGMGGSGMSAPFSFKGGSYPGTGGTCSNMLAAYASCTIAVTFTPTATGSTSSTLILSYHDGRNYQTATRPLQGNSTTCAIISIDEGPVADFGSVHVGWAVDGIFTLTNGGGTAATSMSGSGLSGDFEFKGGSYPGTGGTCSTTLVGGATCTVVVTFAPSVPRSSTSTLQVEYNNGVEAETSSRAMTGSGR